MEVTIIFLSIISALCFAGWLLAGLGFQEMEKLKDKAVTALEDVDAENMNIKALLNSLGIEYSPDDNTLEVTERFYARADAERKKRWN